MTSALSDLRTRLINLFASCAASIVARLSDLGMSPAQQVTVYTVVRAENSIGVEPRTATVSPLRDWDIEHRYAPWLPATDVEALYRVAAALREEYQSTLPYCSPGGQSWPLIMSMGDSANEPVFDADSSDWVARKLIYPALSHHLAHIDDVTETAERFASEVLTVAADTELRYLSQAPLTNVMTSDGQPVAVGPVTVRMLDGFEQYRWYPETPDYRMWRAGPPTALPPTAMLEISSSGPRNDWFTPPRSSVERLLLAFSLHGLEVGASIASEVRVPAWNGRGRWSGPIQAPTGSHELVTLTIESLTEVVATDGRLEAHNFAAPSSIHDLALHRFGLGIARSSDADAIVDFTVALETLLLPYDRLARNNDLSYRFRMHGAHYLSPAGTSRRDSADNLKHLYDVRSALVHGGKKFPTADELRRTRALAYDLCRRGLLQAVYDGFPTAADFNSIILGENTER